MLKKLYPYLVLTFLVIVFGTIYLNAQTVFLSDVAPADVALIEVRNGSTGAHFEVTDREDINFVVEGIQSRTFLKDGVSVGYCGTLYTLTFSDEKGNTLAQFIVNGPQTIRKDPFFYQIMEGDLQAVLDRLEQLEG